MSQLEKSSEISDQFQIMLNELDILAEFEEYVTDDKLTQRGTFDTRDWSFLITQFAKNDEHWKKISPRNANGAMEWKTKGWVQNMVWDLTFADMPLD